MANDNKGIAAATPAIGIGMDIANAVGGWFGGNARQEQQYKYQKNIEKAGGIYIIATDFDEFMMWYKAFIEQTF